MFYKFFYPLLFLISFLSCSHIKKQTEISIEFKGEQVFETGKIYKGLKVGGLSELFFDEASGDFFALSDDKKNHRFYRLALIIKSEKKEAHKINQNIYNNKTKNSHYKLINPNNDEKKSQAENSHHQFVHQGNDENKKTQSVSFPYRMEIKEQILLKSEGYEYLKINMDPEALALHKDNTVFIASEGQQIFAVHEPTQIFTFSRQGILKEEWPVPSVFWKTEKAQQEDSFGQQENKGFESLTLDNDSNTLWTATEKPLKQDLIFEDKAFVRLSAFDIESKKMLIQYPYALKNTKSGLTALQLLKPKVFISLERAYDKQKKVNEVSLFFTDCRQANNVQPYMQLQKKFKACFKKELWNSSQSHVPVDNMEALALGSVLPSGKQLMVLASDNNFNEEQQKTQFLFFELSE